MWIKRMISRCVLSLFSIYDWIMYKPMKGNFTHLTYVFSNCLRPCSDIDTKLTSSCLCNIATSVFIDYNGRKLVNSICSHYTINSLGLVMINGDIDLGRHWTCNSLKALNHYLNQCWVIINGNRVSPETKISTLTNGLFLKNKLYTPIKRHQGPMSYIPMCHSFRSSVGMYKLSSALCGACQAKSPQYSMFPKSLNSYWIHS